MKLSDFDYNLPKELIAQELVIPRDHSRLLVLNKTTGAIEHKHFYDIVDYLVPGDVLVMNNSKVFPARLMGRKITGGEVEVFLLRVVGGILEFPLQRCCVWQCLIGAKKIKTGLEIEFEKGLRGIIKGDNGDGTFAVEFNQAEKEMMKIVEQIGEVPLPPYIKKAKIKNQKSKLRNDKLNYQTIYADNNRIGSVAAPTAGLHFTPELLEKIKAKGVQIEYVTLHVGLGTFAPVKTDNILEHKMHSEYVEVNAKTFENILSAKKANRRIIAVGTTTVRTLESVFEIKKFRNCLPSSRAQAERKIENSKIENFKDWVNIFIYPGYQFKIVDAMITNFHTPKSTLLMLVSAFAGKAYIDKAYQTAIKQKYRFFSYGDAMFIR